jgi:hypothetical protein
MIVVAIVYFFIIRPKPKTLEPVTGILYSEDAQSAVLGKKTIIHEGDTIHGVTVVKIHEDGVEFAKDGQVWKEKVTYLFED